MSIGAVLTQLRADFPDVSISKIRFLEAEGLVEPERTASGYRKFSFADLDKLRYILSAQRDHYLPLRVIKDHLEAMGRGLEPPSAAGESPRAPRVVHVVPDDGPGFVAAGSADLRLSSAELAVSSGLTESQVDELVNYRLLRMRPGTEYFDADALVVATTAAQLAAYGLEPRHMRAFKAAADREIGLIEQIVAPLNRQRGSSGQARAQEMVSELGVLSVRLHAALVKIGLRAGR
ncbi:MAG: transcriptional regulator FtsR [Nocardioidaceae bacterium]